MSIGTIIAGVAFTIAVVNWITHPDTWKSKAQKEVENLSTEQKDIKGN
ncbi:hypothetical protein [Mesomycoplasma hyopneumoniae]|nr:hypothetical protein [Mesomycoplasma hyopneumoniae]